MLKGTKMVKMKSFEDPSGFVSKQRHVINTTTLSIQQDYQLTLMRKQSYMQIKFLVLFDVNSAIFRISHLGISFKAALKLIDKKFENEGFT